MEAIKAANSACGTPVAILELDGALADCVAGGLCCSFCCSREISVVIYHAKLQWTLPKKKDTL